MIAESQQLSSRSRALCAGARRLAVLLAVFALPALASDAVDPGEVSEASPSPQISFSLNELSEHAQQNTSQLSDVQASLEPRAEVGQVRIALGELEDELQEQHATTDEQLDGLAGRERAELHRQWGIHLGTLTSWKEQVGERAEELGRGADQVQQSRDKWEATRVVAEAAIAEDPEALPGFVLERIASEIEAIGAVRDGMRTRVDSVLALQDRVTQLATAVESFQQRIEEADRRSRGRLFELDSPPFGWGESDPKAASLLESMATVGRYHVDTLGTYLEKHAGRFYGQGVLFVLLLLFTHRVRRGAREAEADVSLPRSDAVVHVESRPIAAAVLLTLLATLWIHPAAPLVLRRFIPLIGVIPLVRILSGLVGAPGRPIVRAVCGLILLDLLGDLFFEEGPYSRGYLLVLGVAAAALFGYALRVARRADPDRFRGWWRVVRALLPVAVVAVSIGTVANLVGATHLAFVLVRGVTNTLSIAALISAVALTLHGAVAFLMRRRALHVFGTIRVHAARIERVVVVFVDLWLFGIWVRATLQGLGLYLPARRKLQETVEATWIVGDAEISIQKISIFLIALVVTWVAARVTRVVLKEDVFSRVRLPRGVPATISMLSGYAVIAAGLLFSVTAAGMDLGKLSFIAGGLGVGIGFGLQNVVQNFVSGLILAFERPVQVDDVIEAGALLGRVKEIGVRSSRIRTFDGAEVIIPNGALISKQLINWTLSDLQKRLTVPIRVANGANPHRVIEILLAAAAAHSHILEEPAPLALFKGFGADGLEFALLAWVETTHSLTAGSELGLAIYDALQEAEIDVPTPEQKITVLRQ